MDDEPGLMEGAEAGEDHAHAVEPRHARHLVALIAEAIGGNWEPVAR